eukprot:5824602-Amphidinium_carterae.2
MELVDTLDHEYLSNLSTMHANASTGVAATELENIWPPVATRFQHCTPSSSVTIISQTCGQSPFLSWKVEVKVRV